MSCLVTVPIITEPLSVRIGVDDLKTDSVLQIVLSKCSQTEKRVCTVFFERLKVKIRCTSKLISQIIFNLLQFLILHTLILRMNAAALHYLH